MALRRGRRGSVFSRQKTMALWTRTRLQGEATQPLEGGNSGRVARRAPRRVNETSAGPSPAAQGYRDPWWRGWASVTAGARGWGVARHGGPRGTEALPAGAAQRPATCPPPPRACARTRSRQLPIPGAPSTSPASRAGPRTARLACSELQGWPHVPAPGEVGRCCTVPAPQSPCDPASRRCEARRPASSMRASRRPRRRLELRRPGQRRSYLPLPVTHGPPCAPSMPEGTGRRRGWLPCQGRNQSQAHRGGH